MDQVHVQCFVLGEIETNCYLVWCGKTRQAMVIDPGGDVSGVLGQSRAERLSVTLVVNTHGHADHILGNRPLLEATGAPLAIGAEDAPMLSAAERNLSLWLGRPFASPPPTRLLRDGETIALGELRFVVRATPGHTRGGVALIGEGLAFVGDTLFAGGVGRADLPGADEGELLASIRRVLLTLPDETRVFPGHGEPTTIGAERSGNPFLAD